MRRRSRPDLRGDPVLSHKGLEPLLKGGGDVIAKALPPVSTIWTPRIASSELHKGWVLAEKVRTLPVLDLAAALQSRWLEISDENLPSRFRLRERRRVKEKRKNKSAQIESEEREVR